MASTARADLLLLGETIALLNLAFRLIASTVDPIFV
jgi:hypothetical protein